MSDLIRAFCKYEKLGCAGVAKGFERIPFVIVYAVVAGDVIDDRIRPTFAEKTGIACRNNDAVRIENAYNSSGSFLKLQNDTLKNPIRHNIRSHM